MRDRSVKHVACSVQLVAGKVILLTICLLFVLTSIAEARYSLYGVASLEYERRWTSESEADSITQEYQLGINGPLIDGRLMRFDLKGTLRKRSGTLYEEDLKGFDLNVTLLDFRYVRSRSLNFLNFMPRPIILRYSRYDEDFSENTNYGLSTSWSVPFYINLFGNGKLISIRSIYERPQRLKYNQQVNTENQNANGNANGNANANGNQGEQQNQNIRKEPYQGIKIPIPSLNFDFDKNISELKETDRKIDNTVYDLRMRTAGKNSNYILDYHLNKLDYTDTNDISIERIILNTLHNFNSYRLDNRLTHEIFDSGNSTTTTTLESRLDRFIPKDKDTTYRWSLNGNYSRTENLSTQEIYGINGVWSVSKRLSPTLHSSASLKAGFRESRSEEETSRAYDIGASGGLISTYFQGIVLRGDAGTGYSDEGIPLNLSVGFNTTKWRRFSMSGSYGYNRFFSNDDGNTNESHTLTYGFSALIMSNLSLMGTYRHTITNVKNSAEYREISDRLDLNMNWFYRRHRIALRGSITRTDTTNPDVVNNISEVYSLGINYSTYLSRRTTFTSSFSYDRDNIGDTTGRELKNTLSWYYGRLTLSTEYTIRTRDEGNLSTTEQRFYLKISRYFGRR